MKPEPTLSSQTPPAFDAYASDYDRLLNLALKPSGEGREFFARGRVLWLQARLKKHGLSPSTVLDYGCGTGGSVAFLREILRPRRILGVDISPKSIAEARRRHPEPGVEFAVGDHFLPHSAFDLAFSNGVFHHIHPSQRRAALRSIYQSLVPGGILAFWENNPWNPGTRYIMRQCEFDRDAQPINPAQSSNLLHTNSFEVIDVSSCFYFPRWLKALRWLEPMLARLPLGGQYLVLARKSH